MTDDSKTPLAFTFFTEIGIIAQLSQTLLERSLPDGLRLPNFGVLNHFSRLGGEHSPAKLARAFQVTKGAMTNTLQRLEARGLVEVRPDPSDGRAKRVHITRKGRQVRDKAIAALTPALAGLETRFAAEQFRNSLPFLEQVRRYLDAARDAPNGSPGNDVITDEG